MAKAMRLRLALLGPVLLAAALNACATNPVSGKKEAALLSEERELEIGRKLDPEIRKQYGVYDNPELQAYVQQVGERLALLSHRPQLYYRFTVLDSPEVNAFALPGGYIYITRGLLAYLNSEAELSAVLGHELGHVTARHAVRQYTTATAANIGFTIGAIFVPELANQSVASLVSVLNTALVRGYGRNHELEADRLGAQYVALGGYDPRAMIDVLEVLKNQEEFEVERARLEGREPQIYHGVFATHPSSDQRLQEAVVKESAHLVKGTPRTGREEFLALIDGLVFGDSVSQGVRHGHRFYHRQLGITISFPEDWRIENHPDKLIASSRDNQAKMLVRLEDLNRRLGAREFMHERLKLKNPKAEAKLEGSALDGHTALTEMSWRFETNDPVRSLPTRVTVVLFRDKAYIFYGTAGKGAFAASDPLFLDAARSLRALNAQEQRLAEGLRIRVIEARPGDSFARLAKGSPVPNYPERILRLVNDKYPDGEPTPGSKVKLIR